MLISTFVAVGGPNNLIAQIHRYIRDAISVRSIIPSNFDDHVQRVTHLHAFLPKKRMNSNTELYRMSCLWIF